MVSFTPLATLRGLAEGASLFARSAVSATDTRHLERSEAESKFAKWSVRNGANRANGVSERSKNDYRYLSLRKLLSLYRKEM